MTMTNMFATGKERSSVRGSPRSAVASPLRIAWETLCSALSRTLS